MEPLSEELVDKTWKEMSDVTPEEAYEQSVDLSKEQPAVMSFILEMTEDIDLDIRELVIYLFFVVHRMFERGYGKKIEEITYDEITGVYRENKQFIGGLEGAYEKLFEGLAMEQMSAQPYLIRYIVESLVAVAEADDPILPEEEDIGYIFLLMKSIIDVLNWKTDD